VSIYFVKTSYAETCVNLHIVCFVKFCTVFCFSKRKESCTPRKYSLKKGKGHVRSVAQMLHCTYVHMKLFWRQQICFIKKQPVLGENVFITTMSFNKCGEIFQKKIGFRIYNFNCLRLRIVFSIRHIINVVAVVYNCCIR
jgi:hypothetical protein